VGNHEMILTLAWALVSCGNTKSPRSGTPSFPTSALNSRVNTIPADCNNLLAGLACCAVILEMMHSDMTMTMTSHDRRWSHDMLNSKASLLRLKRPLMIWFRGYSSGMDMCFDFEID